MRFSRFFVAAIGLLIAATAQAGTINPALKAKLDAASPDQPISVIVNMVNQAPVASLNQDLHARHASKQTRHKEIVEALQQARTGQVSLRADLDQELRAGGVLGYTSYWISNLMVVQAIPAEIERIAARSDVDVVEPNFSIDLIKPVGPAQDSDQEVTPPDTRGIGVTPGLRAIHAPEVWYQLHYNGTGALIGSLDTGADGQHPALRTRWRGYNGAHPWQECWLDLLGTNTQTPVDTYGHGTHTTGTMTGLGATTQDTVGVAWGATWIACNAINQNVSGDFDNDIFTAFQWFTDPDGNPNTADDVPDVVQNSWGVYEQFGYPDCDSRWWNVIDNCEAASVCVTWSAGNEGPGAGTLRSPGDRATTLTNAFSVGAVDATNSGWPYPIASWSSRGPTGCNVPAPNRIKPEVSAPGVDVYSSIPGGSYGLNSGTSMAGPHVAGVVALIRSANPDLSVDEIKQILIDTSRDEGTTGEDNTFGWGCIDAYAALIAATVGFGDIQGHVYNASHGGTPIPGATVRLMESSIDLTTDTSGFYHGRAAAATYTVQVSAPGFQGATANVVITSGNLTVRDFNLIDNAGPIITNVTQPGTIPSSTLPFAINATIQDNSTVAQAKLFYRVNFGAFSELTMSALGGGVYSASLPSVPANSTIDYYVWAQDGIGLATTAPAGAPGVTYTALVTDLIYVYAGEDPAAPGWQLGVAGDLADAGVWVRDDPVGTLYNGAPMQSEDDHTSAPGVKCFITANGAPGGLPGDSDVDHGCTTLQSPVFDLHAAEQCYVSYWRWYGEAGNSIDDQFAVDVSGDGGATWVPLERVPNIATSWTKVNVELSTLITLSDQVVFRFVACDQNTQGLVEAGIDDFSLESFQADQTAAPEHAPATAPDLGQNRPNPFSPAQAVTSINFRLSNPASARLEIFDTTGRLVRTLVDRQLESGIHNISWDGLDDQGAKVGAGIYFYRLKAGAFEQSRRMTILR